MIRTKAISDEEWIELRQQRGLSLLQTEIVKGIFRGESRPEMARELAIRPSMVRTQRERVYREFGVSNRVQLVLYVLAFLQESWEEGQSLCACDPVRPRPSALIPCH